MLTPPIAQYQSYHACADDRTLLGISNFWNVISNLPFLIVGLWGLVYVARHRDAVCAPGLWPVYVVFFAGVVLVAPGSGYYHLEPTNESLVWDRLSIAIGFAGLLAVVIGEFISVHVARRVLLPLLVVSAGSVWYWAFTEARGVGDLRLVNLFAPQAAVAIENAQLYTKARHQKQYFEELVRQQLLEVNYGYFSGPGLKRAEDREAFLAGGGNAWCLTRDLRTVDDTLPFLFSRNLKVTHLNDPNFAEQEPSRLFQGPPFGRKAFVFVTGGGSAFLFQGDDLHPEVFTNKFYRMTSPVLSIITASNRVIRPVGDGPEGWGKK